MLIAESRRLHAGDVFNLEREQTACALDSTTIDLRLSAVPWTRFRSTKGGVKLHRLLDLRGNIPSFLHVTSAATHDLLVIDMLIPEAGSLYVLDRGYRDFARLYLFTRCAAGFVLRAQKNRKFRRRYSHPVDRSSSVLCV